MDNRYNDTVPLSVPMAKLQERLSQLRTLPVVTIGDAATDKVREAQYKDANWKPVPDSVMIRNDAGQVREERRKRVRGQETAQ